MNHNEYISQVEIILKNLNDSLDRIYEETTDKNEKVLLDLNSKRQLNYEDAQKLEKLYFKNEEDNNKKISQLKSVIIHLEGELQKALSTYNDSHNSVIDKEFILSEKDNVLSEVIQGHKKTISDLKQKISTLDRECILNLKAKLVEYEEESTIFKNKVNEIEKRMKFEVGKIENEILTPSINTDSKDDSQNYINSKEVREFRVKGINEISNIKQKYLKDIRNLEIKFYRLEAEYDRDNKILREEYNLKIEELKYEITKIENKIKSIMDEYDFNCYKTVNNNELTYQKEKIEINRDFNQKINDYVVKIKDQDIKSNNSWLSESVDVFNTIRGMDEKVNKVFLDHSIETMKDIKNTSIIVFDSLKKTIDIFMNLFTKVINSHLKRNIKLTEDLNEALLINDYKSFNFKDFSYDKYKENIYSILSEHNKNRESNYNNFYSMFKESVSNLINQIKVISSNFDNYISEEIKTINTNHQNINSMLMKASLGGIDSSNNYYKKKSDLSNSNYLNQSNKMQNLENDLVLKEEEINNDFKSKDIQLNRKIENNKLLQKQKEDKDLDDYNKMISSINKSIKLAKLHFVNTVKNKKIEANKKYDNFVKEIKSDQKIKTKIGQI